MVACALSPHTHSVVRSVDGHPRHGTATCLFCLRKEKMAFCHAHHTHLFLHIACTRPNQTRQPPHTPTYLKTHKETLFLAVQTACVSESSLFFPSAIPTTHGRRFFALMPWRPRHTCPCKMCAHAQTTSLIPPTPPHSKRCTRIRLVSLRKRRAHPWSHFFFPSQFAQHLHPPFFARAHAMFCAPTYLWAMCQNFFVS